MHASIMCLTDAASPHTMVIADSQAAAGTGLGRKTGMQLCMVTHRCSEAPHDSDRR
jgi:hypothetical protein